MLLFLQFFCREFLVDLMAAPGTLIPADVLSGRGNSLKTNRKLGLDQTPGTSSIIDANMDPSALQLEPKGGKLPVFSSSGWISDSQSGYETAAAAGSSQTPSGVTSSVPARSIFDGSWTLVSHEQTVEPSTSAGTSQQKVVFKGGENLRNINQPPDLQDNQESKNLFADLNPFGGIESMNTSIPFKGPDNRNNELQRRRENVVPNTGRPQQRLVMKNWSPYNDVSNNKQYNYVEDSFARRNIGDKGTSSSQAPRPATRNAKNNVGLRNDTSYGAQPHNYDSIMAGTSAMKISSSEVARAPEMAIRGDLGRGPTNSRLEDPHCLVQPPQRRHPWGNPADGRNPMNRSQNQAKQSMEHLDVKHDHMKILPDPKKSPLDRFMDTSMPSRNTESVSPSLRSQRLDTMFDDVSECEIPWEDLIIGERIGLGTSLVIHCCLLALN
jgi:hypothetical protein